MKFRLVVLAVFLMLAGTAKAQISGETEIGSDNRGGEFASQYLFYDWQSSNLLARYFWVNGQVNRAEFGFGPTLKLGTVVLKLSPGFDTNPAAKVSGTVVAKVANHNVLYIFDQNWTLTHRDASWFYEKLFVAIDEHSVWQFRIETLNLGQNIGLAFLRIGGEYQIQFSPKRHLYIAPFWDPIVHSPGGQIGYRFF